MSIISRLSELLNRGSARTALLKKNIAGSFLIKAWQGIIQLLIVPLSLDCLTNYEYGLWLTINSILMGMDAIDVGFGNGLRNLLAQALAKGDRAQARAYVTTTLAMLTLLMVPVVVVLILLIHSLDCYALLNVSPQLIPNLPRILSLSITLMGLTFIFKCIGNVYLGLQLPAINNLLVTLGQTLAVAALAVLAFFQTGDLLIVALVFTLSPLLVYIAAYPITFCGRYRFLAPHPRCFQRAALKKLFTMGILFFIIQITGILLFQASNLIISNLLTPQEVAPYQVAYRYFGMLYVFFAIIAAPLWTATTDAYTRGEWQWIRRAMHKMQRLLLIIAAMMLLMLLVTPWFVRLWTAGKIEVPTPTALLMAIYCYMLILSNTFSYILFGIGKIKLMTLLVIPEILLFIPLQYLACQRAGVNGLLAALILATAFTTLFNYMQYRRLASGTAKGIWSR